MYKRQVSCIRQGEDKYIINPEECIGCGTCAGAVSYTHLESNAFPGMAVKLLSAKSNSIFVGFEDAKKRLPKAKNVILTGTPTKVKKLQIKQFCNRKDFE